MTHSGTLWEDNVIKYKKINNGDEKAITIGDYLMKRGMA